MKKKILSFILAVAFILPCMVVLSACKEKVKRIDDATISVNVSSTVDTQLASIKTTTSEKRSTEQNLEKVEGSDSYQITNAHRYNKGSLQVRINLKLGYKILKSNVVITEKDNKAFNLYIEQQSDYNYIVVISMDNPDSKYDFTVNKLAATEITTNVNFGKIQIDENKLKTEIVVVKGTTEDTGIDPTSTFDTQIYEVIANPDYDDDYAHDYEMIGIYNSMGNFVRLKALHEGAVPSSRISLNLINPVIYIGYDGNGPDIEFGEVVGINIFPASFLATTDQLRYTEEFLNTMFSFDFKEGLTFEFAGFTDLPGGEGKGYKFVLDSNSLEGYNGNGLNITFNPTASSIK